MRFRRQTLAVALAVVVVAIVLTGLLVAKALPGATPSATETPATDDSLARNVPTLRPIWPPASSTAGTRKDASTPVAGLEPASPLSPVATPALVAVATSSSPASSAMPAVAPLSPLSPVSSPVPAPRVPASPRAIASAPAPMPANPAMPGAFDSPLSPPASQSSQPAVPAAPTLGPMYQPTDVPGPRPPATPMPQQQIPPTTIPTEAPQASGAIVGRILIDGQEPGVPLTLTLETQSYKVVAHATAQPDGTYVFANVPDTAEGYNVVFSLEANPESQADGVTTWAWLGPAPVRHGERVDLPGLELALQGFRPLEPETDRVFVPPTPSPEHLMQFEWLPYPGASDYWVDLSNDTDLANAWQSPLRPGTIATWDGMIDGAHAPGVYWWSVGARKSLGSYTLVVYSHMSRFEVK